VSNEEQEALAELDPFDYELPPELIATRPAPEREDARLMVLAEAPGEPVHARVRELSTWLRAGDLLVVNATRVLPARLVGRKRTGGGAEALLLGPADGERHYRALVKSRGRLRVGGTFEFGKEDGALPAEIAELGERGEVVLAFGGAVSPYSVGLPPLPPYILKARAGRAEAFETASDEDRYQTVFARVPGSVAAPTAGLHLSRELLADLCEEGIEHTEVVLHVGASTFRPLTAEQLREGRLHREVYELPTAAADAIARTRERGGRVVAVGTTTVRVLESCAREGRTVSPGPGETRLFLRPGSAFRVVDGLLTNFHLPRSSLLLLVAAFAGTERLMAAYETAVAERYRFYSYGDAMLIL
jgi:S-adenosylmethionine:tRNA ribosyltransferase-isomerase